MRKYYPEILVLLAISAVLFICLNPNWTWMNTDSDGAHYTLAAKYLYPAHNTSAPFFLLLGHLFLKIPLGTDAWRMGLILVLSSITACVFIYLITRRLTGNRLYSIVAMLLYGSSALVISQSTIIDTYALMTMLLLGAYYFLLREKWVTSAILMGIALAIHPLLFLFGEAVFFVYFKNYRKWKITAITWSFLLFYAYTPIVGALNNPPDMWHNSTIYGFIRGNWGTITMLSGGLSIWDFPKRVLDTLGILGVSLGLGFFVLLIFFARLRKWQSPLPWLVLIPIAYFASNLSAETYVYLLPAIAFGAVIIGVQLSQMKVAWSYAVGVVALYLLIFNANYFDIGRTLDKDMTAMKYYNEELAKVPDGQILMAGGWNWTMIYVYNKYEGRHIIPVSIDTLPAAEYRHSLKAQGVKFDSDDGKDFSASELLDKGIETQLSIVHSNPNVWIVEQVNPRTCEVKVIPGIGNESVITEFLGKRATAEWRWKPSNPYDFISGKLEVGEWSLVLWSNRSVIFFVGLGTIGYFTVWMMFLIMRKRNETRVEEKREA